MSASMISGPARTTQQLVACAVCGIEVPPDEAVVPEVTDRLTYLCGFDCYARWRAATATSYPSLST